MTLANGPVAEGRRTPGPVPPGADSGRVRALLVTMASLFLLAAAVFGRHGLLEVRQFRLERDRLVAEIATLERGIAALEAETRSLESDAHAVERIAREELGLARPGEVLILLAPPLRHDAPVIPSAPGLDALPGDP